GDVARDVGGVAVALDDDAVLVVALVGRTHPPGALGLVQRAGLLQLLHDRGDLAARVQRVLVEEDVEIGAELVEALLDLLEHEADADPAERLPALVLGQRQRPRFLGEDGLGDLVDVGTRIAVLRRRLSLRGGQQRGDETVDLRTRVVEVVLAGDLGALGRQHAPERVPDGGPAGAAEMDGPGRVGRDELQVDSRSGERVAAAERLALGEHAVHDLALGVGGETQVQEPGSGHLGGLDAVGRGQLGGEGVGQLARRHPYFLRDLQRPGGRVVAVLRVAGSLPRHLPRKHAGVEAAGLENRDGGRTHEVSKGGGSHPASVRSGATTLCHRLSLDVRGRIGARGRPGCGCAALHRGATRCRFSYPYTPRRGYSVPKETTGAMASGKKGNRKPNAVKAARGSAVGTKNIPWGTIIAVVAIVLLAGGVFGYYYVASSDSREQKGREQAAAEQFTPSKDNPDPSTNIRGVQTEEYQAGAHVLP